MRWHTKERSWGVSFSSGDTVMTLEETRSLLKKYKLLSRTAISMTLRNSCAEFER